MKITFIAKNPEEKNKCVERLVEKISGIIIIRGNSTKIEVGGNINEIKRTIRIIEKNKYKIK